MRRLFCVFLVANIACIAPEVPDVASDGGGTQSGNCDAADSCCLIGSRVTQWISSHNDCAQDADCIYSPTYCGVPPGTCAIYFKNGSTGLSEIIDDWNAHSCGAGQSCAPECSKPARSPACVQGKCAAKPEATDAG